MKKAIASSLVFSAANANEFLKEISDGSIFKTCPKTDIVHNFDTEKYFGRWYEAYRTKGMSFESGDCTMAEYSKRDDGKIKIVNSEQKADSKGHYKKRNSVEGWGQEKFPGEDIASLQISFSRFQPIWAVYDVLDTDYETYAVVHSCLTLAGGLIKTEDAWVLTREPLHQDSEDLKKIKEKANEVYMKNWPDFGNFDDRMRPTYHGTGCDY